MAIIEEESFDSNEDQTVDTVEETPSKQEQPQPAAVEETLPDKYKDKSVYDIVKMHQEAEKMIGRQAQEVHEVRSLADQLLKRQLESESKPPVVESAPEVDFFENPHGAIRKEIENNPAVLEAKAAALELKKIKSSQEVEKKHPDVYSIVKDEDFLNWVKQSPIRVSLYTRADAEFDFNAADELLSTYKEIRQARNSSSVPSASKQQQAQALKAASVDVGGSGEVTKKVYRRADLIRLKMTDPDRYDQLQPEIMAAYSEGRVK